MELGYVVVLRKGKSSPPYELDHGEHTIGSSTDSNIRLKFTNPLLLETHAVIRVHKNGVATIINKSAGAPVRVNGKNAFKPTILRHEDKFEILDKEFQYFNQKLKDEPEDSEIYALEKKRLLAGSRKSVMPLAKTPARSPTYKTKAGLSKTPSQRLLNTSLRTSLTKSLNKNLKTPSEKSFNRTVNNALIRRSVVSSAQKRTPASLKIPNGRQSMPMSAFRSSQTPSQIKKEKFLAKDEILSPIPQSLTPKRNSRRSQKSSEEDKEYVADIEPNTSKINNKSSSNLSTQEELSELETFSNGETIENSKTKIISKEELPAISEDKYVALLEISNRSTRKSDLITLKDTEQSLNTSKSRQSLNKSTTSGSESLKLEKSMSKRSRLSKSVNSSLSEDCAPSDNENELDRDVSKSRQSLLNKSLNNKNESLKQEKNTPGRSRLSRSVSSSQGEDSISNEEDDDLPIPQNVPEETTNPNLIVRRSSKNNKSSRLSRFSSGEVNPNLTDAEKSLLSRSCDTNISGISGIMNNVSLQDENNSLSSSRNYSRRSTAVMGAGDSSLTENDTSSRSQSNDASKSKSRSSTVTLDRRTSRRSYSVPTDANSSKKVSVFRESFNETRISVGTPILKTRDSILSKDRYSSAKRVSFFAQTKVEQSPTLEPKDGNVNGRKSKLSLNLTRPMSRQSMLSNNESRNSSRLSSRINKSGNDERETSVVKSVSRTESAPTSFIQQNISEVDEDISSPEISLRLSSSHSKELDSLSFSLSGDEISATQAVDESDDVLLSGEEPRILSRNSFRKSTVSSSSLNSVFDDSASPRKSIKSQETSVSSNDDAEMYSKRLSKNVSRVSVNSIDSDTARSPNVSRKTSKNLKELSRPNNSSIITIYSDSTVSDDDSVTRNTRASRSLSRSKTGVQNISKISVKGEQPSYSSDVNSSEALTSQNSREITVDVHQNSTKDLDLSKNKTSRINSSSFDESTQDNNFNGFQNKLLQRKSTFDESTQEAWPNLSSNKSVKPDFSRSRTSKRTSSTFDESTQDNNFNSLSSNKSMKPISILDDTEEVLSPVKPLTSRTSTRISQSRESTLTSIARRSSTRNTFKEQKSENSSLTMTSVEQSTGSAISVSSQSFSSFKKARSNVEEKLEETEVIDVVNVTSESIHTPEIRKSVRVSGRATRTPVAEERLPKRQSMTAQMFDDVSYTSTPFHKPQMSKKSQEFNDTENANSMTSLKSKSPVKSEHLSDVLVISSTNVIRKSPKVSKSRSASSSVTEVTLPKRRSSSRSNISRNGEHNCVSCRHSSVRRSRSLSASSDVSAANKSQNASVSPVKKMSSSESTKGGTPLLHRKSAISLSSENTPEKSTSTEDETPKSHVKPTRRSSKANLSTYNPVVEDITPVTPEKFQVSGFTEEAFKTPVNTPGLFESIRKSVIRSRKRHRESTGSVMKDSKRARVDFNQEEEKSKTPVQETGPVIEKPKRRSPLNRLSNFEGVKQLMKSPPKSPKNDLRNIPNLRRIMSPKQQKSPKNDLTAPLGVKKLLRSPKKQKLPVNDLTDVSGVAKVFNVSGVDILHQGSDIENSEDLFTKLTGKKAVRAYSRGKSLSPNKAKLLEEGTSRKTMGDLPVCSPRVQQWVEDHAGYEDAEKPTFIEDALFENILEKPQRKSKTGRSVSPKKSVRDKTSRRKTQGDALKTTPDISEWKTNKSIESASESEEDILENISEKAERSVSEQSIRESRVGRSVSPKKNNQTNMNRRKTRGDSLEDIPNVEERNDESLLKNVVDQPRVKSRQGRSISPKKASRQDPRRRKTQGDKLIGTPNRDQLKSTREVEHSRRSSEMEQSTENVSTQNISDNEDIFDNMEEKPKRASRSARSISPKKSIGNDTNRRKTHDEQAVQVKTRKSSNLSSASTPKQPLQKLTTKLGAVTPQENIVSDDEDLRSPLNVDEHSRRFSEMERSVQQSTENASTQNIISDNEDIFDNMEEKPKRTSRSARSISPKKSIGNNTNRRKTHGDVLKGTPNVDAWRSEEAFQVKTRKSSILSGESTPKQTLQKPTRKLEAVTPQENILSDDEDLRSPLNVDEHSRRFSEMERSVRQSTENVSTQNIISDNEDIFDNMEEKPKSLSRSARSISPKKSIGNDINRRKTHGDFLKGTPNVDAWRSEEAVHVKTRKSSILSEEYTPKQTLQKPTRKLEAVTPQENIVSDDEDLRSPLNVDEHSRRFSEMECSVQQSTENVSTQNIISDNEDLFDNMEEKPKRTSRSARSISPKKSIGNDTNRRKTHGDFLKGTPNVDAWKSEKAVQVKSRKLEESTPKQKLTKKLEAVTPQENIVSDDEDLRSPLNIDDRKSQRNIQNTPLIDTTDTDNSLLEHVVDQPRVKSRKSRSISPNKANQQDRKRRKTQGDKLIGTPNLDQLKGTREAEHSRRFSEMERSVQQSTENVSTQNISDNEDLFDNMEEKPKRKSRSARSISPKKSIGNDTNRRKTHGDFLKGTTPNVDAWRSEEAIQVKTRKSSILSEGSTPKQTLQKPTRKLEAGTPQENIVSDNVIDTTDTNDSLLEHVVDQPRVKPRRGRSISPNKASQQDTKRRKTQGDTLIAAPNLDQLKRSAKIPLIQVTREVEHSRRSSRMERSSVGQSITENVSTQNMQENIVSDDEDLFDNMKEKPKRASRSARSISPKKSIGNDTMQRKTHGDFLKVPPNDDLWRSEQAVQVKTRKSSILPEESTPKQTLHQTRKTEAVTPQDITSITATPASVNRKEPEIHSTSKTKAELLTYSSQENSFSDKVATPPVQETHFDEIPEKEDETRNKRLPRKQPTARPKRGAQIITEEVQENEPAKIENKPLEALKRGIGRKRVLSDEDINTPLKTRSRRGEQITELPVESEEKRVEVVQKKTRTRKGKTQLENPPIADLEIKETATTSRTRRGHKDLESEVTEDKVVKKSSRGNNAIKNESIQDTLEEVADKTEDVQVEVVTKTTTRRGRKQESDIEETKKPVKTRGKKNIAEKVTETPEVAEKTSTTRTRRNAKVEEDPATPTVTSTPLQSDDVIEAQTHPKTRGKKGQNSDVITPSSPVKRGNRRGKKLQNEVAAEEKTESTDIDEENDTKLPKSRSKRNQKQSESEHIDVVESKKPARRGRAKEIAPPAESEEPIMEHVEEKDNHFEEKKSTSRSRRNVKNEEPKPAAETSKPTRARPKRNVKEVENTEDIPDKNNELKQDAEKELETNKAASNTRGKRAKAALAEIQEELLQTDETNTKSQGKRGGRRTKRDIPENSEDNEVIEEKKDVPRGRRNAKKDENNQVVEHEDKPEPVTKKATNARGRKAKEATVEEHEPEQVAETETTKLAKGRARRNAKATVENYEDDDVEFNKPIRGRRKKIDSVQEDVSEKPRKRTRLGAVVETDDDETSTAKVAKAESPKEVPKKTTTRSRGKKNEQPPEDSESQKKQPAKPKNKRIEEVIEIDLDSPRATRAKRGTNKKYSLDEYEVPESSKRKVHFADDSETKTPEGAAKRTRRAKK